MAERPPQHLTLKQHRDLQGRERRPWTRRALLAALTVPLVLGLANAFGQRPDIDRVASDAASLEVHSPTRLRAGLYYESRFTIRAREPIDEATLVLEPGWLHGFTLNTVEPSPVGEASRDGRLALELGHIPAGSEYILFLHFQVNPTTVGRRDQRVTLADGETPLATLDRTTTVFP